MKCAIAVFAKTIGLSPVKTRLEADIGKAQAEAFYAMSKNCIRASLIAAQQAMPDHVFPFWVLAEEEGPAAAEAEAQAQNLHSFPAVWTGDGGLGKRLANVSHAFFANYDAVFMIGTDSPQIGPQVITDAVARLLQMPDEMLAGPARDGGFYLFGSASPVPRTIWEKVKYSCDTTLEELEWLLDKEGATVRRLKPETDVDMIGDFEVLEKALLAKGGDLLPEQLQLLKWLGARR